MRYHFILSRIYLWADSQLQLDADKTCHVISAKILVRLDKQKDRVEISPQQLLSAAREAEALSAELARPVRVVGWYHSHPHITVWPSAVDLGTQDTFQVMDAAFAGLIFAVYPEKQVGANVGTWLRENLELNGI